MQRRQGAADADRVRAELVHGRRGGGGGVGRGGGAVVVAVVGAVAVQGEGGGDRAQEGGGAGQGVLHAGPGGGGDQAPGLHPPGAGAHGRPHAPGGGRHPQADRQGQQAPQAARQDMPQKGTVLHVKCTATASVFPLFDFTFDHRQ